MPLRQPDTGKRQTVPKSTVHPLNASTGGPQLARLLLEPQRENTIQFVISSVREWKRIFLINTRSCRSGCWNCFRSTLHRRIWILPKHAAADAMQKQWLLLFSTFSANYIFHRSFPLNGSGVFLKIASNTDRLMNPCAIRRMILP